MNSSKTANLLMTHHNYVSRGKSVFLIKPTTKKADNPLITTRAGLDSIMADVIVPCSEETDLEPIYKIIANQLSNYKPDVVMVDEAQFLQSHFIKWLIDTCDWEDIDIMAYGLKTDYHNKLFNGTTTWFALADKIQEVKTICDFCKNKALFNKLKKQDQDLDGNIHITKKDYNSVCRLHY